MAFGRDAEVIRVLTLIQRIPLVGVLELRQLGKSTRAGSVAKRWAGATAEFDREDPRTPRPRHSRLSAEAAHPGRGAALNPLDIAHGAAAMLTVDAASVR